MATLQRDVNSCTPTAQPMPQDTGAANTGAPTVSRVGAQALPSSLQQSPSTSVARSSIWSHGQDSSLEPNLAANNICTRSQWT
jgi:hypothetical protein